MQHCKLPQVARGGGRGGVGRERRGGAGGEGRDVGEGRRSGRCGVGVRELLLLLLVMVMVLVLLVLPLLARLLLLPHGLILRLPEPPRGSLLQLRLSLLLKPRLSLAVQLMLLPLLRNVTLLLVQLLEQLPLLVLPLPVQPVLLLLSRRLILSVLVLLLQRLLLRCSRFGERFCRHGLLMARPLFLYWVRTLHQFLSTHGLILRLLEPPCGRLPLQRLALLHEGSLVCHHLPLPLLL
mmetsp:Transcript_39024/g.91105  ORF Transcript_39024/g.91105 Transcript_39024/m.91105 type:complete len:237 (-) Transcript_39024:268-978(-)